MVTLRECKNFITEYIFLGYGMTELGPVITTPVGKFGLRFSGKLMPNVQAKVVDPRKGYSLSPNTQGELLINAPTVSKFPSNTNSIKCIINVLTTSN